MFGTAQAASELQTFYTIPDETVKLWEELFYPFKEDDPDIPLTIERVNRGAALLDEKKPKWVYGVLPENLDMSCSDLCIIGQSYGTYSKVYIPFGMTWVEADELPTDEMDGKGIDHGFLEDANSPFALLDRVWSLLLVERHTRAEPLFLRLP
jgi:hypothetical protein